MGNYSGNGLRTRLGRALLSHLPTTTYHKTVFPLPARIKESVMVNYICRRETVQIKSSPAAWIHSTELGAVFHDRKRASFMSHWPVCAEMRFDLAVSWLWAAFGASSQRKMAAVSTRSYSSSTLFTILAPCLIRTVLAACCRISPTVETLLRSLRRVSSLKG